METNNQGFTIIEVTLFLAISALLLMGLFAASSSLLANTRFTDSIRGLESFLQRQYEEVVNGVNPRSQVACGGGVVTVPGSAPPGGSHCLLLGKAIVFSPGSPTVKSYDVVSSVASSAVVAGNPSLDQLLASYNPQSVPSSMSEYSIPWSTEFRAGERSDSREVNAVALLRNPTSSEIGAYHFQTSKQTDIVSLNFTDFSGSGGTPFMTAHYCMETQDNGTKEAALSFSRSQGSTGIQAVFDFAGASLC